jgi:hypothetical protein
MSLASVRKTYGYEWARKITKWAALRAGLFITTQTTIAQFSNWAKFFLFIFLVAMTSAVPPKTGMPPWVWDIAHVSAIVGLVLVVCMAAYHFIDNAIAASQEKLRRAHSNTMRSVHENKRH